MTLVEFRRALARIIFGLNRAVARSVEDYGAPVTEDQRDELAAELLPVIARARRQAHALGAERLRAQAREAGVIAPPLVPIRPYRQAAVVSLLENATRVRERGPMVEIVDEEEPRPRRGSAPDVDDIDDVVDGGADEDSDVTVVDTMAGRPRVSVEVLDSRTRRNHRETVEVTDENRHDPDVVEVVSRKIQAAAARHARMPSREAITDSVDAAADDDEGTGSVIGWARVLTGAESCGYCAMLASRGPVYKSKAAALYVTTRSKRYKAGEMNKYHDDCDCEVVMVRRGVDWVGRTQFEELELLWMDSTAKGEARRPGRKLLARRKSLRQFTAALNREIADGNAERFIVRPAGEPEAA